MSVLPVVSLLAAVTLTATALFRPASRSRLPWPACAGAALSLGITLVHVIGGVRLGPGAEALGMVESAALMALAGLVVRYGPARSAVPAAAVVGVASSVWMLRFFVPASALEGVGVCAFWGAGALLAAGAGAYLRSVDARQERAVADSRTALRLQLARDLHDFVAHDISEMVAHAQAGGVAGDPRQALERVEAAGQRAMSMLDRTLDMLHRDRPRAPVGDLGGVREAAERFSAAGAAPVHVSMNVPVTVPAETAALAYRIVIEGLTNIRRHAPDAGRADLDISAADSLLEVTLTNDGVARTPGGRRGGGTGLAGLAALVRAQGGELLTQADPGGWSLTARLPLAQSAAWSPVSSSPTTRRASAAPSE